jgi:hypothetical protein
VWPSRRATVECHLVSHSADDRTASHGHCWNPIPLVTSSPGCSCRSHDFRIRTANDAPFVREIIGRRTLPGAPPDLVHDAKRLSKSVSPETSPESCPACSADIPMADNAVCEKRACLGSVEIVSFDVVDSHAESSALACCSIISFVLSTPMARTCIGCSRKALSPIPSPGREDKMVDWLPACMARCWLVDELLPAVCRRLFCGNSFVGVL